MALSKKMIIIGSSVGLILLIVVTLSVVMSKSSPTQRPTQKITTRAPTQMNTTRAPTQMNTTRAPTQMNTTRAPIQMNTTRAPTQMNTTRAPTQMNTTLAPTTKVPTTRNSLLKNQYLITVYTGKSSLSLANLRNQIFLMSPNDIYRLYLQTDGNIVLYKRNTNSPLPTAVWSSNSSLNKKVPTNGTIYLKLVLENNGDLVLYYYSNKKPKNLIPVYRTNTGGKGGNKLVLQDDGNLVIYRNLNNTSPVWSSSTGML